MLAQESVGEKVHRRLNVRNITVCGHPSATLNTNQMKGTICMAPPAAVARQVPHSSATECRP
jgi:hypothetical protein